MTCQALSAHGLFALAAVGILPLLGCSGHSDLPSPVTNDAAQIRSQIAATVAQVLVEDRQNVEKGALLVQLDAAPLRAALQQKLARLELARAEAAQTHARARAQAVAAAAAWSRVVMARIAVRENVARLHSATAMLKLRQSERSLSQRQYERAVGQAKQRLITPDEMDERKASLEVAEQQVSAAAATVAASRAVLGLDAAAEEATALPSDWERSSAAVRTAGYDFAQRLAELGYDLKLDIATFQADENPLAPPNENKSFHEQLVELAERSPDVRLAATIVGQAEQEVRQVELALSQTEVRAPLAGVVTRRSVNPGNRIEPGQTLLLIRPANSAVAAKPAVETVEAR